MFRVLIVGAGVTGAVTASLIRKYVMQNCYMAVWEQSCRPGGRMATTAPNQEPWCTVDLGAQYLSPTPQEYEDHLQQYKELADCGLLKPLTCQIDGDRDRPAGTRHFVAPHGMSSVVKHFLSSSDANVYFSRDLRFVQTANNSLVAVSTNGITEQFDCVVFTAPVPEVFHIGGDVQSLIDSKPDLKQQLQSVEYSTRFAFGLFFNTDTLLGLTWSVKYFDDPIIRYISVDTERRSVDCTRPTMVLHTTVNFGLESGEKDADDICMNVVLPQLYKLLPQLPKPTFVVNHRWKYSQVYKGFPNAPGAVTLHSDPLIVIGGDAFSYSKFDGCISSAHQLASTVTQFCTAERH